MPKVLFAISLVSLLACGTGESDSGAIGSISDTPAVSAAAPRGDEIDAVEVEEIEVAEGEQAPPQPPAASAPRRARVGRPCAGVAFALVGTESQAGGSFNAETPRTGEVAACSLADGAPVRSGARPEGGAWSDSGDRLF